MCPPRAADVIGEIGPFWTDESLFVFLESYQNKSPNAPLPIDVFADINPYLYEPSNLPENIWYLVKSDCPKQSEFGFWRVKDDLRPIYSGSLVIGWKTTLEFHRDRSSNGDQTDWLMHEYSISLEGSSEAEGNRSLCRVFFADEKGENPKTDQNQVNSGVIGRNNSSHDKDDKKKQVDICEKTENIQENGDAGARNDPPDEINEGGESESLGDQLARILEGEDLRDVFGEDLRNDEHLPNDDYLELADLLDPLSSSSTSESSSCVSLCSDVYFDSIALLNELGAEVEEAHRTKPSTYNHSTAGSRAPEVFGAGASTSINNTETAEPAGAETRSVEVPSHEKRHHEDDDPPENAKKRPPPASNDAEASSSGQGSGADDGKKADRGKTIKKFFCFLAF